MYELSSKRIIVTRDVSFQETKFPFIDSSFDNQSILPSLPITSDLQEELITESVPSDFAIGPPQPSTDSHISGNDTHPIRHSNRQKRPPVWLTDFVTNHISESSSLTLPIQNFSNAHANFLAKLSNVQEPQNYQKASKSPYWV